MVGFGEMISTIICSCSLDVSSRDDNNILCEVRDGVFVLQNFKIHKEYSVMIITTVQRIVFNRALSRRNIDDTDGYNHVHVRAVA
jgi:hypothetical protein